MKAVIYRPERGEKAGRVFVAFPKDQAEAQEMMKECDGEHIPAHFQAQPMNRKCFCNSDKKFKRCCFPAYMKLRRTRKVVKKEAEKVMHYWTSTDKVHHLSDATGKSLCGKSLVGMAMVTTLPPSGRVCKTCERMVDD